jgi:hypothetical protein
MAESEEVAGFIRSSFRSVWSLEVLLLLKREPRSWTAPELVAALRASDLIVAQSLEALAAAGLVALEPGAGASYRPVPTLARLADETESLYARSPDAVRRLIVGAPSGLAAFADAFRLRRD